MGILFDLALNISLIVLAWRILYSSDHFQAVVLFIIFGLILSLAWLRLLAPDIAIAEAAVGAGIAGVMLLDSLRINPTRKQHEESWQEISRPPLFHKSISFIVILFLTILLILTVTELPRTGEGLTGMVNSRLEASGTEHPVTAVLLNFRGYDTWLELGILMLAVIGVLCIRNCSGLRAIAPPPRSNPVLGNLAMLLTPLILLVSGYLLWRGGFAPGGAFQAGVVLAAGCIFLWVAGYPSLTILPDRVWRILITLGFLSFLVIGTYSLSGTGIFLAYDPQYGAMQIFLLETAASLSIGAGLAGIMIILQPLKGESSSEKINAAPSRAIRKTEET
ncbi:MAG: hydrogenase subunit MbhD domain-containing protein [Desulforhopalus sp.]